ncbi:selenium metabolism-associated LysR family transcriptional regulator [Natribacillus halophilus]|uniref:DNA-binding transcriptional regulator, LysR family n=1 Tax=Natribacillus halophilus TaxID=549003 RepID=A0A1G8KB43_9BACI|nr:selenium metabolism-associated LysR family transcriptional regulator [Natribacillus halophilus]SDI40665.1 DNA-binding transcriptional regulator, LysR family [Natribacillus halophilus]
MNHDHLETFMTVADQKSFSEAARILYLSQPTITSHIKALESTVKAPLFVRTKKYVELTPAAKTLYPYVKNILDMQVRAQNEIDQLMRELHGKLIVASSLTIGESILPSLLFDFKTKHPQVELYTEIINSQQIVELIKNNELEFGLIEAELDEPLLDMEPFMSDELLLVTRKDYFSSDKNIISIDDFRSIPLVLREKGSGTRTVIHQYLAHNGISPHDLNVVLELGSTESVKAAVEAGLGVSILSKHAIRKELDLCLFETYPINSIELSRHFYIVYKKNKTLSLISEKFSHLIYENSEYFSVTEDPV